MSAPAKVRVLVVDDEPQIRRMLQYTLVEAGYEVDEAETGRTALGEIALHPPGAIILDLGLPDVSGLDVLRAIRPMCEAPILILSVFGQEGSKIEALDAGAEDYLTKPFGSGELLARLRVALRRRHRSAPDVKYRFGPIEIDFNLRRVVRNGQQVKLTATEYDLLHLMIAQRDKVLTHKELLRALWGPAAEDRTQYLRVYLMRLRQKLGEEIDSAGYFQTEPGIGYRFVSEPGGGRPAHRKSREA